MNHWNNPPTSWGAEELFGASIVIALFASIALSFWPGWPAIHAWLTLPLGSALVGWS
jgi:hypothetical protein